MTRPIKWVLASIGVLVVAIIVAAVVIVVWPDRSTATPSESEPDGAPGTILASTDKADLPIVMRLVGAKGSKIQYVSTDSSGRRTRVSGTVFSPGGQAPPGGWPVIALGHGTTGINSECAPSGSPDLFGLIGFVQALVGSRYAVAVADFQGLGAPGVHPYLDNETAGRNIIDSVRAARNLFGTVSNRWAGFGTSQGGGATWAANEESASYARDLDLLGTVNAAPTADVSNLVAKARAGTLTADQGPALQWAVEAAARSHPDINRDDYRSGAAATNWDVLSACSGRLAQERVAASKQLGRFDLAPKSDAADRRLTDLMESYAVPRARAAAPMLVLYGDADTYIDPDWTREAVRKACELGDVIESSEQQSKGHADVDISSAVGWLIDRFAGTPAPSNCP